MTDTKREGIANVAFDVGGGDVESAKKGDQEVGDVVDDPWALPEVNFKTVPWTDLSTRGRVHRVLVEWIGRPIALITCLYFFICALDLLSASFRLLGGKGIAETFQNSELLKNPIAGLMIGVLCTVLVQSSSTSTSIVVGLVAANLLQVRQAIPIIMGANIGTSVTNTIVSVGQVMDRNEYRRAFAGATVHDMFNWLSVIILLPIEVVTGYLEKLTNAIIESTDISTDKDANKEILKKLTKPFTKLIVQVDSKALVKLANANTSSQVERINKVWCKYETQSRNATMPSTTVGNLSQGYEEMETKVPIKRCSALFSLVDWSDSVIGTVMLVVSLTALCVSLFLLVKLLNSLLQGRMAALVRRYVNADLPGGAAGRHLTGYVAILLGAVMTFLVQSSSVFTSALTPLVGVGVIQIERMYPLTLGANIGTTATAMLAALASSGDTLYKSVQVALCHLFFNISGILIWYPVPFMRQVPLRLAKFLGNTTAKYRWFALLYLVLMFFIMPGVLFALSLAGEAALFAVTIPLLCLVIAILIIKLLQSKCPERLPTKLRTWKFLPVYLRSLEPYDRLVFGKLLACGCCRRCIPEAGESGMAATDMTSPSSQANLASDPGDASDDTTI